MSFEVRDLSKSYKDLHALKDFGFSLEEGECLALLGPNGAGKTTAVKAMVTLLKPDTGQFLWQGKDLFPNPKAIRDLMGYISQELAMDKVLTGVEFMRFCAGLLHLPWRTHRAHALELLDRLGLSEAKDRPVGQYSGGMKRRLDLASAMLHNPKVLILDEPTTGLDIEAREQIWGLLSDYRKEGGRIVLVSHDFREVDALANQILILQNGETVVQGEPEPLRKALGRFIVRLQTHEFMSADHLASLRELLDRWHSDLRWLDDPEAAIFAYRGEAGLSELQQDIYRRLEQEAQPIQRLNVQQPTLEDVYRFAIGGRT